jgi:pimeloyl-ACP methyl ester carboxylesterase
MAVKVSVESIGGVYEGTLSQDQKSLSGTWTTGGVATPLVLQRATKITAWKIPPSPHTVRFVTVDRDVRLEVLDFGGGRSGDEKKSRPIVLLTGLGNNAHVFDNFAPKLTASHHVYAITRRGFGASSAPADGYSSDRLGDDVLEVLQALKISRPVLMGHSIAGEELSSIGTRHPELVAGLVYLDAGYGYALYSGGDLNFDIDELRKKLDALRQGDTAVVGQLLTTDLPRVTQDLQRLQNMPHVPPGAPVINVATGQPLPPLLQLIVTGQRKYGPVTAVPILAIFADPPNLPQPPGPQDPVAQAAVQARMTESIEAQAVAFEKAGPHVHVVRIPHADHYVFRSNEADVLREINAFIAGLPPTP